MNSTRVSSRRLIVAAVVTAVTASTVLTGSPAAADGRSDADAYVAFLVARHQASQPYNQADDYVRTLVFWAHHHNWTV